MATEQSIIKDIEAYVIKAGGLYPNWYVGISGDARERLKQYRTGDYNCTCRTAESADSARRIEKHFLDLGMDGGNGGGDDTSKMVYAYKKSSNTEP